MTWRALMLGTATAALTLTLGAAASAEEGEEVDYNRLGGYLAASGVASWDNFSGGFSGDTVGGFSVRTGNRLHQFAAVEFQYEYLDRRIVHADTDEAKALISGSGPTLAETDIYTHQITLNFRAYPWASEEEGFFHELLAGRIQPYALTGIGAGIFDAPDGEGVGFVARFGLGLDFYVTEHIVATAEATYALSAGGASSGARTTTRDLGGVLPMEDLDHVSLAIGATYRF